MSRHPGQATSESRITDGQALEQKLGLKVRDDPGGHLILLVADTRANRQALATLDAGLRALMPRSTRDILAPLGRGGEPPGSGIVIL